MMCPLFAEHDNYETLLNDADAALYEAKRNGKGKYVLYSSGLSSVIQNKSERNAEQ
jgi:predicted signal transduction protein with EAL and GGDEF domain